MIEINLLSAEILAEARRVRRRAVQRKAKKVFRAKHPEKCGRQQASYRRRNLQKVRERGNRWYAANRERVAERQRLRYHKVSDERMAARLAEQGGVCAICERSLSAAVRGVKGAVVDHCHTTGRFRGVLCSPCNAAIGMLGDTTARVLRAAEYLQKSESLE